MISNKFKMSAAAVAFVGLTAAFTPVSDAEAGGRHDRHNNHDRHSDRNYWPQPPRYQPPRYQQPPYYHTPPPRHHYQPLPYRHDRDSSERFYDQQRRAYENGRIRREGQLFNELGIPPSGYYAPLPQYTAPPVYIPPQGVYLNGPRGGIYIQIR